MKIGLIGCGVIGERRIQNLPPGCKIAAVYDLEPSKAQRILDLYDKDKTGRYFDSPEALVQGGKCDGILVATVNSALVSIAEIALNHKIPVLIEKPAARSVKELERLSRFPKQLIKIGFNHRFHPAYKDLCKEILSHPEDPIMYIQSSYGNGARLNFDREWRSDVVHAGGGELLDQGVHLLDLASGLLGELSVKGAWTRTHYWDMNVDDNAWAILGNSSGQTFSMHVSSTEWKNDFHFAVYTRQRKYLWEGLGRSYGQEKLTIYTMKPEMGPPLTEGRVYEGQDLSWLEENTTFLGLIANQNGSQKVNGGLDDALNSLKLVEQIYETSFNVYESQQGAHSFAHPSWFRAE